MLKYRLSLIGILMLSIVGCTSQTSTPTLTSPSIIFPTSTINSLPTHTDTTLSSNGAWLVFIDEYQLYAVNDEGKTLKPLVSEYHVSRITSTLNSDIVAAMTSGKSELSLSVSFIDLSSGNVIHEIPLLSYYFSDPTSLDVDDTKGPLNGIFGSDPSSCFKWSPDGRYLAFMGAIDSPTSSLYIYDVKSKSIRKLSDNEYQAVNPSWSLDGNWIVYEEVSNFWGWQTEGIWAASVGGEESKFLYKPKDNVSQEILGWFGEDNFVIADSRVGVARDIRIVNISSGTIESVYPGVYLTAAIDRNGAVAFFVISDTPASDSKFEPAFYLFSPDVPGLKLIRITENTFYPDLIWNSSNELFITGIRCKNYSERIMAFDSTGKTKCIEKPKPNLSPNGAWYIVENDHLGIYQLDGARVGEIPGGGEQILWNPNSDGFFVVANNELRFVSLPSMDTQHVYKSMNGIFYFTWAERP